MVLQSSGSISASQINIELGLTSTTAFNLNSTTVRNLAGRSSGSISFEDLYGKMAIPSWVDKNKTVPVAYTYFQRREGSAKYAIYTSSTNVTSIVDLGGDADNIYSKHAANRYWYPNSYTTRFQYIDYSSTASFYFFVHTTPTSNITLSAACDDFIKIRLYRFSNKHNFTDSVIATYGFNRNGTGTISYTLTPTMLQRDYKYRLSFHVLDDGGRGGLDFPNITWYTALNSRVYWQNLSEVLSVTSGSTTHRDPNFRGVTGSVWSSL